MAAAAGSSLGRKGERFRFCEFSVVCSILPDADVIAFALGIPYSHFFGHRGFFHSPCFAIIAGFLAAWIYRRTIRRGVGRIWTLSFYFSSLIATHGLLDAMTNGGMGIALFIPFDSDRYFLPWTPIEVSPVGIAGFFSARGMTVLLSEFLWVWIPMMILWIIVMKLRSMLPSSRHLSDE